MLTHSVNLCTVYVHRKKGQTQSRLKENGCCFANNSFKGIFLNENFGIFIMFVPKDYICNKLSLDQARHPIGEEPLLNPKQQISMMTSKLLNEFIHLWLETPGVVIRYCWPMFLQMAQWYSTSPSTPTSHYSSWLWLIVKQTQRNKFQWNVNQKWYNLCQENAVCKMKAIFISNELVYTLWQVIKPILEPMAAVWLDVMSPCHAIGDSFHFSFSDYSTMIWIITYQSHERLHPQS